MESPELTPKPVYENPQARAVLPVYAGSECDVTFKVYNDTGYITTYRIEVVASSTAQPAPPWVVPLQGGQEKVPANGEGALRLRVSPPPVSATPSGAYPVVVRIFWDDEPDRDVPFTVMVLARPVPPSPPPQQPVAAPVVSPVVENVPPAASEPVKSDPMAEPIAEAAAPSPPVAPPPPSSELAAHFAPINPISPPKETEVVPPPPQAAAPPIAQTPPTPKPDVPKKPMPAAPPPVAENVAFKPIPKPEPDVRPAPTSAPEAGAGRASSGAGSKTMPPPPVEPFTGGGGFAASSPVTPPPVAGTTSAAASDPGGATKPFTNPHLNGPNELNPAEGTVFTLKPGEKLILRFSDSNKEKIRNRTLQLEPGDLSSLPRTWLDLITPSINLMPGKEGELAVCLAPPLDAEPAVYPFSLRKGMEGSLRAAHFSVAVRAIPAVSLSVKNAAQKVGPFPFPPRSVLFDLSVAQLGNANTAFRIGAVPSETADAPASAAEATLYESGSWRYEFDHDMENLRSPSFNRAPEPEAVRLRVERTGRWWFGFQEKHVVSVRAVPVTEPGNSGKPGNTVTLTATRFRIIPMDALLFVPLLCLLMPFFGGAPRDLTVQSSSPAKTEAAKATTVYHDANNDVYYVVGNPKNMGGRLSAEVSWAAPPLFAPVRLGKDGDTVKFPALPPTVVSQTFDANAADKGNTPPHDVRATSLLGAGPAAKIVFYPTRSDTELVVAQKTADGHERGIAPDGNGSYDFPVPASGLGYLMLHNTATQSLQLNLKVVHSPSKENYDLELREDSSIPNNDVKEVKIRKLSPNAPQEELVLVTSDENNPLVRIRLVPQK